MQNVQQDFGWRMIRWSACLVAKLDAGIGVDNEDTGKLAHIPLRNTDSMSLSHGFQAFHDRTGGEQRPAGGLSEAKGFGQQIVNCLRRPECA